MPPIPAIHTGMAMKMAAYFVSFVAFGLGILAATNIVVFTNDYSNGRTETPLPPPEHSLGVDFGPNSGSDSCPTCIFVGSNDTLLDYYGRPIDVERLLYNAPTPTLPLETSFADTSSMNPKPTPTSPSDPEIPLFPVPTSTISASTPLSEPRRPSPGASELEIFLIWCQNLFLRIIGTVYTTSVSVSRAIKQQGWGITWSFIFGAIVATGTTTVELFLHRLQFWESRRKNSRALDEDASRAEWQKAEKQRLFDIANTHIKETLAKDRAKINRIANQEFRRLHKIHQDKLIETYEKDVFAAANVEPSFGPSLRNAESEFRSRLDKITTIGGSREAIVRMFNCVLHSFTYSVAVKESRPGGHNTRYLSIIDGQKDLIDAFRLLLKYREKAFTDNTSLIESLCRWNKERDLSFPRGSEEMDSYGEYSPEDDMFITSPLDGPNALSMKRFLKSTAEGRAEQEARHVSDEERPSEDQVEGKGGITSANVQESDATPPSNDGECAAEVKSGIKDAGEQNHHDLPKNKDVKSLNEGKVERKTCVKDAGEQNHHSLPKNDDVESLNEGIVERKTCVEDASEQNDQDDLENLDSPVADTAKKDQDTAFARKLQERYNALSDAQDQLRWHERLGKGHGTPEDSDAKPIPPPAPATIDGDSGDAATARRFWEDELAEWRRERIRLQEEVAMLQEKIASMFAGPGDNSGAENRVTDSGSSQAPLGGDSVSPLPADPQPEPISRARKRNLERRRNLQRKRAKGKEAEEATEP